jgi:hypothetical protein
MILEFSYTRNARTRLTNWPGASISLGESSSKRFRRPTGLRIKYRTFRLASDMGE